LLASALLGDELKYRPLEVPPCPSRARSSSHQDRLRQALEEVESTTTWSPEFGDETVDDILRRRVLAVRTRVSELEAIAEPCINARAQLKTELDQLTAKQQRRRVSVLPVGSLSMSIKSKSVKSLQDSKEQLGETHVLADKLALATRTLVEELHALDEAERQRADDDAELVRTTLEHFFRAGLRALQAPRRVSVSAYRGVTESDHLSVSSAPSDERGAGLAGASANDNNRDNSDGDDGEGLSAEVVMPPPAPLRSLADFRPMRKQVRYQYPSRASGSSSTAPSLGLKLPTVDELVAFTTRHLPWTSRSSDPSRT
jgi:hypothetical protein